MMYGQRQQVNPLPLVERLPPSPLAEVAPALAELSELAERLPAVIELLETARAHEGGGVHFTGCEFAHAECLARRALRELRGTDAAEDLEW